MAASLSIAPRDCPTVTCPPILGMVVIPFASHIYIPAAPTAATALLLTRPIQIISTRLYAICINDVPIIGNANFAREPAIGPSSKSTFLFIFLLNPPVSDFKLYTNRQ